MARRALPSGVVTFVLSEANDHDPVEAGGGVVIDRGVSVFARASDAVAAAWAIRAARPQSHVAVHSGETTPVSGDYSGAALTHAMRLQSLAKTGEIVVSGSTAPLVIDAVPTGSRLVALGEARVRELDRPEPTYVLVDIPDVGASTRRGSLVPEGLASKGVTAKETEVLRALQDHLSNAEIAARQFVSERTVESHVSALLRKLAAPNRRELARRAPALLETTSRGPTDLPVPATSLIGRAGEVASVSSLVSTARMVTITGPAGVGKTRLALEAARRQDTATWFVELTQVNRDDAVADRVLWALGGEQPVGVDAIGAITARATEQQMLVVLDNCEHVIAGASAVARALVGAGPGVTVLATSREPLGVADEIVVPIDPLPVADAVQLLADRARAAGAPPGSFGDESVVELCRRLDGLPLAVELVAPRLRTFAPAQLLHLLDRGAPLTVDGRGHPSRHRTLDDALDWSYRLLDDEERVLFDRLAVFPDSFGLDAVLAVCGSAAAGILPRLVDRSLVTVDATTDAHRYRLLDSVRRFGRRHLDDDGVHLLMVRYCTHFVATAEEAVDKLRGPDGASWVARLRADQHNFVHALEWAMVAAPEEALRLVAALHLFWEDADLRRPAITWAERALSAAGDVGGPVRVAALVAAVSLLAPWDQPRARVLVEEALALATRGGDAESIAAVRMEQARVEAYSDTPARLHEPLAAALAYFEAKGDTWYVAELLRVRSYAEEPAVAVSTLADAHARFTLTGDRVRIANSAYMLGAAYARDLLDPERAEPRAREAVAVAIELGSRHEELHGRSVLAECAFVRGDDPSAGEQARECAAALAQLADHRCEARMRLLQARVALRGGYEADALEHARATLAIARLGTHASTIPGALEVAATVMSAADPAAAAAIRSTPPDRVDDAIAAIGRTIVKFRTDHGCAAVADR